MTDEDLKKIRGVIKEELNPVNNRLDKMDKRFDGVEERLGGMDKRFDGVEKKIDVLWDQVIEVTVSLDEVKETQKAILEKIDEKHGKNIKKLSKRVTTVESHLGISTPPELVVVE